MGLVYNKLFALMKERNITTYQIRKQKIISESSLQKLRHNQPLVTTAIENMCRVLQCQPGDIMEYIED